MTFSAGAGRAEIEIPDQAYPVDGFDGPHDPLYARVLVLDDGSLRVALAVLDQTSIFEGLLESLTAILSTRADVAPQHILIIASHTFSAPHVQPAGAAVPQQEIARSLLRAAVAKAVQQAVAAAITATRPARVGSSIGTCDVNVNRDVLTADGWWLGTNDAGISDKEVAVVRLEDLHGQTIAVLLNYAVQSSVMNESLTTDGQRLVSADLAGAATTYVEQQDRGAIALFLIGAAGDQAPFWMANRYVLDGRLRWRREDLHEQGFLLAALLGRRLAEEVLRVSEQIRCADDNPTLRILRQTVTVDGQQAPAHFRDLRPTRSYDFQATGRVEVPVWILQVGGAVLAGLQAELSCVTGLMIKRKSPFSHTLIATMVNGAAKYLPDAESYDRMTYEAMSARYARGAAEHVAAQIGEVLDRLHQVSPAHEQESSRRSRGCQ